MWRFSISIEWYAQINGYIKAETSDLCSHSNWLKASIRNLQLLQMHFVHSKWLWNIAVWLAFLSDINIV